ncbi:hypothetical protein TSOC_007236 [Tetrabaena socialis]|uniref:GIY-YIG domain-containing protein n=1 Tax=Tetrabaena socialis TaxID=47790 RepID=A0A2J8A1K1_9CHLO|nr:hypothetical protein TSOC_007236 [Tetrabaena socialis]|eukprot:PNH06401.1 hypothetical protein TSOC_007236 [Tetrabaena socialis]
MAGLSTVTAMVDDKNVPEGHKGLHGFLYGEGGAEEHDSSVGSNSERKGEDEGTAVMPVEAYLESRDGEKPLGVYCVYDKQQQPQYIGFSRNMVLAIKGHVARVGPERAAHVRAMVYGNRSMATRTTLERGVQTWVDELLGGQVPPGNSDPRQRAAWEGISLEAAGGEEEGEGGAGAAAALASPALLDRAHMSPAEAAAYEEKKLKMRKAMGEKDLKGAGGEAHAHDHAEEEDDLATRRYDGPPAIGKGVQGAVRDTFRDLKEVLLVQG